MLLDNIGRDSGNFLTYLSRRQEVIAANIANADTPGYRTMDVAPPGIFSSIYLEAAGQFSRQMEEASGLPSRNDGNNVSMDREARLLSENSLKFNLTTQMLRAELKNIRSAIEEGRSA